MLDHYIKKMLETVFIKVLTNSLFEVIFFYRKLCKFSAGQKEVFFIGLANIRTNFLSFAISGRL
jgi:hypothetical protein